MGNTHTVYVQPTLEERLVNTKTKMNNLDAAGSMLHNQYNRLLESEQESFSAVNSALEHSIASSATRLHAEKEMRQKEQEERLQLLRDNEVILAQRKEELVKRKAEIVNRLEQKRSSLVAKTEQLAAIKETKDKLKEELVSKLDDTKQKLEKNDHELTAEVTRFSGNVSGEPAVKSTILLLSKLQQLPENINKNTTIMDSMAVYINNVVQKVNIQIQNSRALVQSACIDSESTAKWAKKHAEYAVNAITEFGLTPQDILSLSESDVKELIPGKPLAAKLLPNKLKEVIKANERIPNDAAAQVKIISTELQPICDWKEKAKALKETPSRPMIEEVK